MTCCFVQASRHDVISDCWVAYVYACQLETYTGSCTCTEKIVSSTILGTFFGVCYTLTGANVTGFEKKVHFVHFPIFDVFQTIVSPQQILRKK